MKCATIADYAALKAPRTDKATAITMVLKSADCRAMMGDVAGCRLIPAFCD